MKLCLNFLCRGVGLGNSRQTFSFIMSFSSLPLEVLENIFSWLPAKDLIKISLTCKAFYRASRVTKLWKRLCVQHNVTTDNIGSASFLDFYAKVLFPYGHIIGLWQMQMGHYGGLASVEVVDGEVVATQFLPPLDPQVWRPFKRKQLFKISINDEGRTIVQCVKGQEGPHKMQVLKGNSLEEFSIKCSKPEKHRIHNQRQEDFANWILNEVGIPLDEVIPVHQMELLRIKYLGLQQFDASCTFTHIPKTVPCPNAAIQPGFFKGTYGSHGVEVVLLSYEGNRLHGTKVIGDPNVPAGKLSIEVHLDKPLVLRKSQQLTLEDLKQINPSDHSIPEGQEEPSQQPFVVPQGVEDRGFVGVCEHYHIPQDVCKRRYFGTGLIAMHGFRMPSRTECHFIIFNENVFAFLWMELASISVYSRAEDV